MKKKKHTCPYCGNNPVPHYINWYFDSLNILFEKLQIGLFCNPLMRFLSRYEDDFTLFCIGLGRIFGMISLSEKPGKHTLDRARVLWEEAEKRGLEMREVRVLDKSVDTYIVRKLIPGSRKKKIMVFSGLPRPRNESQKTLATLDDKGVFKKICEKNELPIARGGYAFSYDEAAKIFDRIDHPVIVKPRLGSRGRHAITYVRDHDDLRHAFRIARQLCLWVMVEEQLMGPVYRATVINYELAGVLSGTQPQVVGDGKSTIRDLIELKNQTRPTEVSEVELDQKMAWFLTRQLSNEVQSAECRVQSVADNRRDGGGGVACPLDTGGLRGIAPKNPWAIMSGDTWDKSVFDSIPAKHEVVYLSEKIGLSYGGGSAEEYEICHPDNRALFVQAAKIFEAPIVGFDFMIPDITQSWKTQRCGFLEANTVPFINLHHDPLYGKPRNVAAKVWDLIEF